MKAIIYAAGKTPRLLPLTKNLPVSLLKIKDKTILDLQAEALSEFNFSEIIIVSGYQAEKIEAKKYSDNVNFFYDPYYEHSNIPSSLNLIKEKLKEGFVFLYGDVLVNVSVLKKLLDNKNDITLAVDTNRKGNLDDEAEKVIIKNELVAKLNKLSIASEKAGGEYIGLTKFSSEAFPLLDKVLSDIVRTDIKTSYLNFLNSLIFSGGKVNFIETSSDKWEDIDFPNDLDKAQSFLIK